MINFAPIAEGVSELVHHLALLVVITIRLRILNLAAWLADLEIPTFPGLGEDRLPQLVQPLADALDREIGVPDLGEHRQHRLSGRNLQTEHQGEEGTPLFQISF